MKVFYSSDFIAMKYSIDATRKSGWVAESLNGVPVSNVSLVVPAPASREHILHVHALEYVDAIESGRPRRLAESSTFPWDAGTWTAEMASCGGMIAACKAAIRDGASVSLSVGFHHASHRRGSNHCVFNGLAVAMKEMLLQGVERILCIDLDAHCGGGTHSLIEAFPSFHQLDVSLFWTDKYQPANRSTLDLVESADEYLPTVHDRLSQLSTVLSDFQLCLYYAGMDPHEGSGFGGLPGITSHVLNQRDRLVFETLARFGVPVAVALGGGYLGPKLDQAGLVQLHRSTIELAAANCATRD